MGQRSGVHMNMSIPRSWSRGLVIGTGVIALAGCFGRSGASKLRNAATFDAPPAAEHQEAIESQLKRFKGQTSFLNPRDSYFGRGMDGDIRPESALRSSSSQRAVQESDIFKVGKPGTKLLFLLNNYRGLQVVSFEDGALAPKILGRVDATGNYPTDMYYDSTRDRLLVLERVWQDDSGRYNEKEESRLLSYDVSNPASPVIKQIVTLKGDLSDSRMVGSVLYVAASERSQSSWGWERRSTSFESKGEGHLYALQTSTESLSLIAEHKLALPVSSRENMNIIEVQEGAAFKYYLVAILSESGWGWWDRKSVVELVDISDEGGKIEPIMIASAKGSIAERSQTFVRNNTLIVTSNYLPEVGETGVQRIAVETFKLPTAASEVISPDEAQFRKLYIERAIEHRRSELNSASLPEEVIAQRLATYRLELVSDSLLGVKGRFVNDAETTSLRKLVSDFSVTVGSTQGQNASLQDVRYHGNLLYVYWVPANNIDPLDLFDVSAPETEVKYLGRLEFDGWIQRAVPVTFQNREYVVGLGWVIPAVNNENNRRYPQAMLFEITRNGTQTSKTVIAQLTLESTNVWANFNDGDKTIEFRLAADGKGSLMFPIYSWDGRKSLSGGKVVGFDLSNAILGQTDKVFIEGGVIAGSEGWLRRVFTNAEISKINTFTDEELGTFDMSSNLGDAATVFQAAHVLELARNVVAYAALGNGSRALGVQVISKGDWWYNSSNQKTILRLVDQKQADAERLGALAEVVLEGSYQSHLVSTTDGSMLVLSTQTSMREENDDTIVERTNTLSRMTLDQTGRALLISGQHKWTSSNAGGGSSRFIPWYYHAQKNLVQLDSGEIFVLEGEMISQVQLNNGLVGLTTVALNCSIDHATRASIEMLNGKAFLTFVELIADPDRSGVEYEKNYLMPVTLTNTATCGAPVNIPGTAVAILGDRLVTRDNRLKDIVAHDYRGLGGTWYEVVTELNLDSLKLDSSLATLNDLFHSEQADLSNVQAIDGRLLLLESEGDGNDYYSTNVRHTVNYLSFDDAGGFIGEDYVITLSANKSRILKVASGPQGQRLAVVGNGRTIQVMNLVGGRPSLIGLSRVLADGSRTESAPSVFLPNGWALYGDQGQTKINYSPEQSSLEIAQDMYGVTQLYLGTPTVIE